MRFDIITIFPKIFDSYFDQSMIKRAREKKLVDIRISDLRVFAKDKPRTRASSVRGRRQKVDDRPYGGGPGMVLQIEPLARAIDSIRKNKSKKIKDKAKIIFFTAGGKQFDAKTAREWAKKYDRIIMIAGHYEGVDERIKKIFKIEEISVGPYVLTGGELPAMIVVDAVSRHIKGVLGKHESLEEKRLGIGVPVYTRPETFFWPPPGRGKKGKKYKVPSALLSGNHKEIEKWRKDRSPR